MRDSAPACLRSCVAEGMSWKAPLRNGMCCKQPLHPFAGELSEKGRRQIRRRLLRSTAGATRIPRSGLVQLLLCRMRHNRRSCAKMCRAAGGELEQIQLLLGHASVQTTERYLGTKQDLVHAPNDAIQLRVAV